MSPSSPASNYPAARSLQRAMGELVSHRDSQLGQKAVQRGWLSQEQLNRGVQQRKDNRKPLAHILMDHGWITRSQWDQLADARRESDLSTFLRANPPQMPPEVEEAARKGGTKFGRYILVEQVGQGGMGKVWRAWDDELGRWVAVKVLKDETSIEGRKRFLREARAVARLRHPNLMILHDAGEMNSRPYLVMELIRGSPFDVRQDQDTALHCFEKITEGLREAHRQGVTHRDLKPGNILVDQEGEPHLVDFGLAHLRYEDESLTQSGLVMGTPQYMSPEQLLGAKEKIGSASDVYALGVILYEILTHRHPYSADTAAAIYEQMTRSELVPPQGKREWVAICRKALQIEPENRYPTAGELLEDVRKARSGERVSAEDGWGFRQMQRWIFKNRKAMVTAALLGLCAGAVWWGVDSGAQKESLQNELNLGQRLKPLQDLIAETKSLFYVKGANGRSGEYSSN